MTTAPDTSDHHHAPGAGGNDTEAEPKKVSFPAIDGQSKDVVETTEPEVAKDTLTGLHTGLQPFSAD